MDGLLRQRGLRSLVGRGHYKELLAVNDSPEIAACPNPDSGLRIWEWIGQSAGHSATWRARPTGTLNSRREAPERFASGRAGVLR